MIIHALSFKFLVEAIGCNKTLFVLKQYKTSGVLIESIKDDDTDRLVVTP